jgi:uncharacterized membrane protein
MCVQKCRTMTDLVSGLVFATALGSGVIGGVFFGFSSFIMRSLARLPAPQGIAAMQSINLVVINPWFMVVFFGTAVLSLVLGVLSALRLDEPGHSYVLAGALLYLAGTIIVTIAFNVPRNNRLAAVDPESAEGAAVWEHYVPGWTAWNSVRTIASVAASAAFIVALMVAER